MSIPVFSLPAEALIRFGMRVTDTIHYQKSSEELVQDCLRREEGVLNNTNALVIRTGTFTGRSPRDRFFVRDENTAGHINWNDFNQPIAARHFDIILKKMTSYLNDLPEIWVRDAYACADHRYRLNLRIISETATINLFAYNMFLRPEEEELDRFKADWQILSAPGLKLDPAECGVRQPNAVIISFEHKIILAAGTSYTGEIKKAVFTILNYILPHEKNVLSMHCSANMGAKGDTAIFFGLSGTGKTTLSADSNRRLIGDDEHGWNNQSVFNFEGGCYAKCIQLSVEKEPEIFHAVREGALVENVGFVKNSNVIDFNDSGITENTRVSYPLNYISNAVIPSAGPTPKNIFFLTCDAYSVLPPISKLDAGQAMYQFISGYTAKIAGTETGITEPKSTFSACFGAPFLPLHPGVYAALLGKKIKDKAVNVWLVNTGWMGGPYGTGNRIKLANTRAMITAVLNGKLDDAEVEYETAPFFGFKIPRSCPGVSAEILNPRNSWADKQAYDVQARALAMKFIANFEQYKEGLTSEIIAAGPKI